MHLCLVCAFASVSTLSLAQETQDRPQNHILALPQQEDHSFFTLTVENDLFGSGTDENYTSGIRLTYFSGEADPPEFVKSLGDATWGDAAPFFEVNETTHVYYAIGQNLYTPKVINIPVPDRYDRPYAAFLYGSIGYSTLSHDHLDDIELTLGVIGPAALGEPAQKTIHDLIGLNNPKGWDSQLKNEPAVMIAYQRSWPEAYAAHFHAGFFKIAPHAGVTLGNVYTYANAGMTLQLVPERHKSQALPVRIRPAIPGSGDFSVPEGEFSWSLFAGVDGRIIARNIFLDGNTFKGSPSVDKKHTVLDANAGFTITYDRIQMAYTLNWRSDEFDGQSDNAVFGSISLGYRF